LSQGYRSAKSVIDCDSQARVRYWRNGNAIEVGTIKFVEHGKKVGCGLLQVRGFA
jgi:hypothetical protein